MAEKIQCDSAGAMAEEEIQLPHLPCGGEKPRRGSMTLLAMSGNGPHPFITKVRGFMHCGAATPIASVATAGAPTVTTASARIISAALSGFGAPGLNFDF